MTTKIYKTKEEFFKRENKNENGVSEEFAKANPNWEKENETNKGCWNCFNCSRCSDCSRCSRCSDCSDCSDCFNCFNCSRCSRCSDCSHCSYCSDCSHCSYCSDCSDCSRCSHCSDCFNCFDCSRCSRCSDCSDCSDCSRCSDEKGDFTVPIIKNIHQRVLEASTQKENSLNMSNWHTCSTTHCRAGWVVTLAGEEGKKLEDKTSTLFAAMQIYKASSPIRVSPVRFFETNDQALADMQRCAEEEKNLNK